MGLSSAAGATDVSHETDDGDDFFNDMPDFHVVNDGPPPDYTIVEDDDDDDDDNYGGFQSASAKPAFSTPSKPAAGRGKRPTESKKYDDDDDFDEEYDVWTPPADRNKKTPKRNKTPKSMAGTSWMQKNQAFLKEDIDDNRPGAFRDDADDAWGGSSRGRDGRQSRRGGRDGNNRYDNKRNDNRGGRNNRDFREDFRGTRVFVQNIPDQISWQDLKDHFRVAGEVVFASVSVDPNTGQPKGHGVVQFETTDMAENAIRIMRDYPLGGVQLFVREDVQEKSGPMSGRVTPGSTRGPTAPTRWKCADEDGLDYLSEQEYREIRSTIKARDDARRRRNYDAADDMRDQLKLKFGVHLDDRLKLWWASWDGGQTVPKTVSDIKGDGRWGKPNDWRQIPTTPENDLCVDADLVEGLLKQRDVARREKDFPTADALLEQARTAPDGDLTLRIHDESRTWRIWTEEKPVRPPHQDGDWQDRRSRSDGRRADDRRSRNDGRRGEDRRGPGPGPRRNDVDGGDELDQRRVRSDLVQQCMDLVMEHAPEKKGEVTKMLKQFPGRENNILQKLQEKFL